MQKVDVQMSPKPYDTKRLWCSQGDTGLRKFGFHLMDGIDEVDISNISDPVFSSFNEYAGGTEELLPTNTSTPSTSPILADIQYSDGLREDQSFTYRESPTEEDGKAKVKALRGNTLKWNQLVQNGNFESTSGWASNVGGNTLSASSNELTVAINTLGANVGVYGTRLYNRIANHKYLFKLDVYVPHATTVRFGADGEFQRNVSVGWNTVSGIAQSSLTAKICICYITATATQGFSTGESFKIRNYQCFDLTQMGLDSITSVDEFTSLFPLPFYDFNQGTLIPFSGNGIKTIGFNQWDEEWEHGSLGNTGEDTGSDSSPEIRTKNYIPILPNTTYYLTTPTVTIVHYYGSADLNNYKGNQYIGGSQILNIPTGTNYIRFRTINTYGDYKNDICLNISDPSRNGEYEPYKESSLSLPISQYFPTGMKSAGNVYDELTPSKAVKRLGMVDLGTLNYIKSGEMFYATVSDMAKSAQAKCINYVYVGSFGNVSQAQNGTTNGQFGTSTVASYIFIHDSTFSDATAFKTAMSGVYLVYELATPLEQSITSASLVTINGESDLYKDGEELVCDCNEEISKKAGIFDAKIRFTDADGDCYSNKLKISVEAKP